jgi:hypothetical protein
MASFCGFSVFNNSNTNSNDNNYIDIQSKCLVSPVSDQLSPSSSSVSLSTNDSHFVTNNNERTPILRHVRFVETYCQLLTQIQIK